MEKKIDSNSNTATNEAGQANAGTDGTVITKDKENLVNTKNDESKQDRSKKKEQTTAKFFGIPLPGPLANVSYAVHDFGRRFRKATIQTLPGVVVNNSSNVIGLSQLIAEVLMFKAGGVDLVPENKRGNPLNYIIEPPKSILSAIFGKAQFTFKAKDLVRPSFWAEEIKNFNNLERATLIDSKNHTVKLINRNSSRSGFSGITAMAVATLFPDEKETPETIAKNVEKSQNNPIGYYAGRIGQAVWFPAEAVIRMGKKVLNPKENQHIGEHKRQFSGLGMMSAGTFSVISGFRQVEGKFPHETQHYMRNKWQMMGGAITTAAGWLLMTGVDNQKGWTDFGATQMLRLIPLVPSITTRFKPGPNGKQEQGAGWYLGAQAVLQTKNVIAVSIGGAEKKPDGTIIDHNEIEKDARQTYTARHPKHNPANKVSQVSDATKAMPERKSGQQTEPVMV